MDTWLARFDGQTRYFLDIFDSLVKPDVLRFRGREALSEPFRWDIEFTTPQANIPPEDVLMKYASLRMRSGKNVHGIITRLEWLSTSKEQSHYRATLSSRLTLLEYTRQCAIFQNQSVPEVVEQVLRKHGLEGADFEFRLARSYPSRELITQWRESDLQFIRRILSEVGIYWRTEMDNTRELDTFIFADSPLHYQFDVHLPCRESSGLFDGTAESVWDVRTWHNIATSTIRACDYNYRTAFTPMDAAVSVRNDAVTIGEHYRYAAPYRDAGDDTDPEPETESGAFYARLHHERELNTATRIHLFSNAAHLTPGQVLEPQSNTITALKDGVILTLVTFRGARDSRLHVSVWGLPYSERYCFRPVEIPRPVIPGTLPARIESRERNDIYAHLDEQGRYRVKLDFDREGTEPGYGYLWLRMAKPTAGETLGWHTPLIDGTEVAITYSNGDIDLPYIAYALHDSEHPDPVNRDNHTRNILRTPASSELRMEDKRGEEHIRLATEYGRTQLSSGHLVDSRGEPRGEGLELRTDERGTLRAGKGLFVSADVQAKAQGGVLDMDAALKQIDRLNQQLQQLEIAAEKAQALKADVDSQIQMFEQRLKPLNKAVLFSAPEGMALTSGEDMQLGAVRNLAVNAGGDISAGSMGNMTALAGEKLGLFARTGQLSLKSGEGPIEVQAQNASLRLFAEKKLTLSSASDISFAGKKRITLIGGGSYLRLEAGKVEYGTTATYMRRVKRTMAAAPMAMSNSFPVESQLNGVAKNLSSINGPDKLTTETILTIPADRSRRRIGVGEVVTLICTSPVSGWTISPTGKGKVQTSGSNTAVLTAFDKAGNVTVIATTANGKNSAQFTIVEPSAFVMNRVAGTDLIHHKGSPDCGWLGRPYLHPVDVNFAAVSIRERDSQAIGSGPYQVLTGRWHGRYNPSDPKNGTSQWFRIDANEYSTTDGSTLSSAVTDTIFAGIGSAAGIKPPFTPCILSMPIIWEWTIDKTNAHSFPENEQKHEIFIDGKCTTSKALHKETTLYSDPDSGLGYIKR